MSDKQRKESFNAKQASAILKHLLPSRNLCLLALSRLVVLLFPRVPFYGSPLDRQRFTQSWSCSLRSDAAYVSVAMLQGKQFQQSLFYVPCISTRDSETRAAFA